MLFGASKLCLVQETLVVRKKLVAKDLVIAANFVCDHIGHVRDVA